MKDAAGFLETADCLTSRLALREILLQTLQALREREHEPLHVWLLLRGVGAAVELGVLHVLEHQEPQQTDRGWPRSLRTSSRRAYFALLRGTKEPPVVMGCPIRLL